MMSWSGFVGSPPEFLGTWSGVADSVSEFLVSWSELVYELSFVKSCLSGDIEESIWSRG
jgi:hypothetical protein